MRISYVVSTMVFWWRENRLSLEQECHYLRSLGFGVELWPNTSGLDECRYDQLNWPRLVAATEGMKVAMRSRNDSPTMEQWAEQIECARLLRSPIVADFRSLGIEEGSNGKDFGFAAEIAALAADSGVRLCLETGSLPRVLDVGDKIDSLFYCLDTGWANLDRSHAFREYVDALAYRTVHLHLNDNYGEVDDHEPPGLRGGICYENWQYLLDSLAGHGHQVMASLEMSPSMPAVMIRQATEYIFGEMNWPNPPRVEMARAANLYHPR